MVQNLFHHAITGQTVKVSRQRAIEKAKAKYEAFNKTQRITSDFDKSVRRVLENQ